ncbi:MAG: HAMP domain-containing protein [Myxococcales bacterium]|nr:HAMP domain-containing protein [Myxococcales bacterium]
MKRRISIRARWALRYSAASLGLILTLSLLGHQLAQDALDRMAVSKLEQYGVTVSEIIARHADEPLVIAGLIEAEIAGSKEWDELAIELYDRDGTVTLQRDFLAPFSANADFEWARQDSSPTSQITHRKGRLERLALNPIGFTRTAMSLEPFTMALTSVENILFVLLVASMLLSGLLGWWQARLSLRPISRIVETARAIDTAAGDQWMPTSGTKDELDVLALTLNDMLQRIRSGMDRMRRFATQAAHELSTPLTASRTTIEVTLEHDRTPEEYRKVLEGLLVNAELLSDSIHATLDIARSEAGLSADRVADVDLHEVLESVIEFFEPIAEERGIAMKRPAAFHAVVRGDRMWLHRMISGLLDNAVKYSGRGDEISFEYLQRAGIAELDIRDTGVGISARDRDHVFERFYRGDGHPDSSLGLGLPLAMEIARAHSGNIQVESPERGGSIFRILLPLSLTARLGTA